MGIKIAPLSVKRAMAGVYFQKTFYSEFSNAMESPIKGKDKSKAIAS